MARVAPKGLRSSTKKVEGPSKGANRRNAEPEPARKLERKGRRGPRENDPRRKVTFESGLAKG